MKLFGILLFSVLVWCHLTIIGCEETNENERAVAESSNQFTMKFYKELSGGTNNLVASPFSVQTVLSMLLLGLQGDTEKRVSQALLLPESRSQWTQGFKSIITHLQNTQDVTLEIAYKIYIQKGFNIKESFQNETEEYFKSAAEEVDIANKSEEMRLAMNQWAAEKTHNKIKDIVAPGSLYGVVTILLNAIYFKGTWKTQFNKEVTRDRTFYLNSGSEKEVPMMYLRNYLAYAEFDDINAKALKLPYKGEKFSMLLILPNERKGLADLESNLEKININKILKNFWKVDVHVNLPKFKIVNNIDLSSPVMKLGAGEIFSRDANFSGVTDESVHVSTILQKAFIEVNEEGTEAAVVTTTYVLGPSPVPLYPKVYDFNCDHPFLYMIIEETKGTILFIGRVMEPSDKDRPSFETFLKQQAQGKQ